MSQTTHPRTVEQAAEELNVAKSTVRAWIAQRRIGHVHLGRAVRIPRAEVERLLTAGYQPAAKIEAGRMDRRPATVRSSV